MGKWDQLLQGLGGVNKSTLNAILQNTANSFNSPSSSQVAPFTKFVFPIIRRASPQLVASSIVSVQPMTGPVGGIFYYRPYGSPQNPMKVGDAVQTTRKINKKIITGVVQKIVTGLRRGVPMSLAVVENAATGKTHRIAPNDLKKVTPLDVLATVSNS